MKIDSVRGVWFPPRPFDGGTPTSFVGGELGFADAVASSVWMIDSTSSIQIRTFSGFRSIDPAERLVYMKWSHDAPVWITPQQRCM